MSSKYFRNLSHHVRFDSRDRNTRLSHWFTSESITNACAISYANREHVVDDSQRVWQNNAQTEHESRSISHTQRNLRRVQTRMSRAAIVHELTIFDKRRVRFMSESDTIRSRAVNISSTTKKENRRLSCRSLKAEMKDLLRHRAHVDFDSDRRHRQKSFAAARSVEKDRKLTIDSDSNRENRLRRLFVQTKDSRSNVDLVSMRLRQSNDQARDYVLRTDEWQKLNAERRRHHRLSSDDDFEQKIQNNHQMITSTQSFVAIRVDYRITLWALILFFRSR
jgi:hypothetical protein